MKPITVEIPMTAAAFDSRALSTSKSASTSRRSVLIGRVLSGIAIVFLVMDTVVKLLVSNAAVEANNHLGYAVSAIRPIGIIELVCLILYAIPRTSRIGALLFTGYLGGAIASQFRAGNPLFSFTLFPIYIAILIWGGLWLRDAGVRAFLLSSPASDNR